MNTLTTIYLVILFFMIITVACYFIWEEGKRNAKNAADYDKFYSQIYVIIETHEVCEMNYKWIMRLLTRLGKMKYRNKEKTSVLTMRFFRKYQDIAKKRAEENS